ncbi:hypothetical protein [Actinoplanes sp. NPDC051411]|uniref:hypothetical protein n=1 Tax=Actinoplanes sp. NPDC051411 TaxID=3155522 RepID=UPI0034273DBA
MNDTPVRLTFSHSNAGKWLMAQLEFFPRSQLASWRDRSASRNYSPERDRFAGSMSGTVNGVCGNVMAAER